jgi:hypothetical protein
MLGADISRCNGVVVDPPVMFNCPLRDKCLRFLTPPVPNHPRQSYVIAPYNRTTGQCPDFKEAD